MIWRKVEVALDVRLEDVDDFGVDGATLSVESDTRTSEVWDSGFITVDELTYVVPFKDWNAKRDNSDVPSKDKTTLLVLSSELVVGVDRVDVPSVVKTTLQETFDDWLAEVGALNVNALEETILEVVSDSCFEDPNNFDCSVISMPNVVMVYAWPKVNDLDATTVYGRTVATASDSWEARADTFGVTAVDGTTCVIVSDSLLPGVDDFDVTAVNERILEVVNGAWLAYDDDFDVLGVDGPAPAKVVGVWLASVGVTKFTSVNG